jgi:hypothetical protein
VETAILLSYCGWKCGSVRQHDFVFMWAVGRVVDESGEDYLYPQAFFVRVSLPETVEEQVLLAA